MVLQFRGLVAIYLVVHIVFGFLVTLLDVLLDRADLVQHLGVGLRQPLHLSGEVVLLLVERLYLSDLLTLLSVHLFFLLGNFLQVLLGHRDETVKHDGGLAVGKALHLGEVVLHLLLAFVVGIKFVVAGVHLAGAGAVDEVGGKVLVQDDLGAVEIDLCRLLHLLNLISLDIIQDDLQLPVNSPALLMPLF